MFLSDMTTLFDVAPGSALWIVNEAENLDEALDKLWGEVNEEARLAPERGLVSFAPERLWLAPGEIREELSIWPRLEFHSLGLDAEGSGEGSGALRAENISPFRGRVEAFVGQLRSWRRGDESVVIVAEEKTLALRIQALLREHEVGVEILPRGATLMDGRHDVVLAEGKLGAGFRLPDEGRVFFRAQDLLVGALGRDSRRLPRSKPGEGFKDLSENDLVVHVEHGVGPLHGHARHRAPRRGERVSHPPVCGGRQALCPDGRRRAHPQISWRGSRAADRQIGREPLEQDEEQRQEIAPGGRSRPGAAVFGAERRSRVCFLGRRRVRS